MATAERAEARGRVNMTAQSNSSPRKRDLASLLLMTAARKSSRTSRKTETSKVVKLVTHAPLTPSGMTAMANTTQLTFQS